jgi:hypothetical protein
VFRRILAKKQTWRSGMVPAKKPEKFVIRRNPQESGKWEAAGMEAQTGMHNQGKDIKI